MGFGEVTPAATTQLQPTQNTSQQVAPPVTETDEVTPAATTQLQPTQNTSQQVAPPAKKIDDTLFTLVS
ncbi:hypothetical protein OK508_10765, partial [Streptococcus pneumoniae]|nr:hypothetical protein [Streptococcus pneumoniae]